MANRYPLVVDTSDSNKIKELPSGDNLQLSGNDIVGVVNITGSGTLSIETINATTINSGGTQLATVATSGSYTDLSNVPTNVSSFTNDSNYITSGSNISLLTNNAGYLTTVAFSDITDRPSTLEGYNITDAATITQGNKADSAIQPADNVSRLTNDAGYITLAQVQNGDISVDVNNTGDLIGSVFGQDSTVLIDGILSAVNTTGTIRGHTTPNSDDLYDLGSSDKQFRNAYLSGTVNANTSGFHTGDVKGSVFADDSSLLIDAVNGEIPGYVKISDLKTALQDGAGDYAAFKAWVLANL